MQKPTGKDKSAANGTNHVVQRNIHALVKARRRAEQQKTVSARIADVITAFSGSMLFVYLHVLWFAVWIVLNLGIGGLPAFDPFPFGLLTMIVSLEAIFLSTFVLISQNRQAALDAKRNDLDLQIDLLSEHEVTRMLCLVTAIAKRLGVELEDAPDLDELQQEVSAEELMEQLEEEVEEKQA